MVESKKPEIEYDGGGWEQSQKTAMGNRKGKKRNKERRRRRKIILDDGEAWEEMEGESVWEEWGEWREEIKEGRERGENNKWLSYIAAYFKIS